MSGLQLREDVCLKDYTTLALSAKSRHFVEVGSVEQLREALLLARRMRWPLLLLGGGSNLVLTRDHPGLAVRLAIPGIQVVAESESFVKVKVACGEGWHGFVSRCLDRGWYGLENLALIPGDVGACPIQNVGAYGVEVGQFIESVEVLERDSLELSELTAQACRFAYRDSLFKGPARDRYVITAVTFRLRKVPALQVSYGALGALLAQRVGDVGAATPRDLFEVVCQVRAAKLPDPVRLPNVGSFFKNPVVSMRDHAGLVARFPDLVAYPETDGQMKLAAGWLIDRAGWKGRREGAVGVHEHQALVLVNHGGADGEQVLRLAGRVAESVKEMFGVELEIEPRIY